VRAVLYVINRLVSRQHFCWQSASNTEAVTSNGRALLDVATVIATFSNVTDKRTDGHTDTPAHVVYRASMTSRRKNRCNFKQLTTTGQGVVEEKKQKESRCMGQRNDRPNLRIDLQLHRVKTILQNQQWVVFLLVRFSY